CVRIGPLLDEDEGAVGLVQRVEIATGLGVHRLDGLLTRVPDRVHRLGLGFHDCDNGDGHGDGLLAGCVLDGCLAYLGGFRIGQPMSTHIVMTAAPTANTARRTVSTAPNRVASVLPTRSSLGSGRAGRSR